MAVEISAFRYVPPFAQGYVKDLRIRWACEEAGIAYRESLLAKGDADRPAYRAWQPFGQVPAYRDGEIELFESGAILLHLASQSDALGPREAGARARMSSWVFAALSSIETWIDGRRWLDDAPADNPLMLERLEEIDGILANRLTAVADAVADRPYLMGAFTVADIAMATVLREIDDTDFVARLPALAAYQARCLDRPAFAGALEAQLSTIRAHAPADD